MSLDSSTDLGALTRVVYGEARGESDEGKIAVAWTVINRHNISGKSIQFEATKKNQF
jgi:spore germination cell wall hydrolase CwlJ-like protein